MVVAMTDNENRIASLCPPRVSPLSRQPPVEVGGDEEHGDVDDEGFIGGRAVRPGKAAELMYIILIRSLRRAWRGHED